MGDHKEDQPKYTDSDKLQNEVEKLVEEVKVTALPQTSFAGAGSSTQIVKFPVAIVVENTLT